MSILTIDPQTYDNIQIQTIASFVDQGFDLLAARNLAKDYMERSFHKFNDSAIHTTEGEVDAAEKGIYS